MTDRTTWTTTTHRWAADVDRVHLEHVRRQLGRGQAAGGRRHLMLEVLAYAQDEAASLGHIGTVTVTVRSDGTVTIDDDGRGTDTRTDSDGAVVRKPVMATADVRFNDVVQAPRLPDGLPRRGMSTVSALSEELVHDNHRGGSSWSQTYRFGIPDDELTSIPYRGRTGTRIAFRSDVDGPSDLTEADLRAFPNLEVTRDGVLAAGGSGHAPR